MDKLDHLAMLWGIAKRKEDDAKAERINIENDILKLHPAREEGSDTVLTGYGNKIKLTGKMTYKADVDKLIMLAGQWPVEIRPYRTKLEADETRLKAIRSERPDLWAQIAPAVEIKPAKTGVSIEFKNNK